MSTARPLPAPEPERAGEAGSRARKAARSARPFRDRLELAAFRAVAAVFERLPERTAHRVSRTAARRALQLLPSRRRILAANLGAAFPAATRDEIAAIARGSVEGFAAAIVDFLRTPTLTREELLSRVAVEGEEHLRAARARGRGVFLLSAHFGGWEIGALVAGLLGEPISPIVRPLDNRLLEQELHRRRSTFGNRPIAKKQAARELLKAMRRNETVAILLDQNTRRHEAVFVPFFGRPAATNPSLARLQLKTDATVVPVFTWPEGAGRYRLVFEQPIVAEEFRAAGEDRVVEATARYMAVTEAAIRRAPPAWFWLHDRWSTGPRRRLDVPRSASGRARLVVAPNWLGDSVLAIPFLRALRRAYPDDRLVVLARRGPAAIFRAEGSADEVLVTSSLVRDAAAIRRERFGEAWLLPNSFRSGVAPFLAGVPRRIGYATDRRGALLTERRPAPPRTSHQLRDYDALLASRGIAPDTDPPRLPIPPDAALAADRALDAAGLAGGNDLVLLAPGAAFAWTKRWPPDRFGRLSLALRERGFPVAVVIGPGEEAIATAVVAAAGGAAVPVLGADLDPVGLAALAARARLVVSNDSGPMHLAAAVGTPVVALFGPTDPGRTGPSGPSVVLDRYVFCSPCFLKECPYAHECLREISVEDVLEAVRKLTADGYCFSSVFQ